MYIFETNETPVAAVKRVMRERMEENIAWIEGAGEDPVTAVHEARKNIKRARALLRLARFGLGENVYMRENYALRDVGRLLSELRDLAVIIETIRVIFPPVEGETEIEGQAELVVQLEAKRKQAYREFVTDESWRGMVTSGFIDVVRRLDALEFELTPSDIENGLQRVFKQAYRQFQSACRNAKSAEAFHEWRKQVKYLWYQHELLSGWFAGRTDFEETTARLDHLSDLLGLAHDAAVLGHLLGSTPEYSHLKDNLRRINYFRLDCEGAALAHGDVVFKSAPSTYSIQDRRTEF